VKILITGSKGKLGRELAEILPERATRWWRSPGASWI
jgi:dTDP-4-dehydrorhamnose reductase